MKTSSGKWLQQYFDADGQVGLSAKFTFPGVLAEEAQWQVDLDGDGSIGDAVRIPIDADGYLTVGEPIGLYSLASGGFGLDVMGLSEDDRVTEVFKLLQLGTKLWTLKAGSQILGMAERPSDGNIEIVIKSGKTLSARIFDMETGLAMGGVAKLASSDAVTNREQYYQIDLNGLNGVEITGVAPTGWEVI